MLKTRVRQRYVADLAGGLRHYRQRRDKVRVVPV
ncbi:hypothetical protein GGR27_001570 [Lewinella antarctica]|uniref:Uncharacterized protein n=1 Tax=Neolewinella antarctica TaxID=442734 RepID=A0ABX0X9W3_9BACT|nr:hypothetical protein [Neolewinella antarctica]